MSAGPGYFRATRHPWPSFLFLLPLLIVYEGGVIWLGGGQPEAFRNGADAWVRWSLAAIGMDPYWAPALVAVFFMLWSWIQFWSRPNDLLGVVMGMGIESVFFALGLWGISRGLAPFLDSLGIKLAYPARSNEALGQIITFIGAGIYEEFLFRLLLFSSLFWGLRTLGIPSLFSFPVSALAAAAIFSAAHHIGAFGESFNDYVFLFRMLAGLYFTLLFQFRGIGIAAGAHALYDVIVGISLR